MLASLVIGHGKALLQMPLDSAGYQREVVSALDVEVSKMPLTPAASVVIVVLVELGTSKVTERYETLEIGIAKVPSRRLYRLGQRLEVLIVQQVVMDHLIDGTRQHGERLDPKMVRDLQGVNLLRGRPWSEHRPRPNKTANGERR